MKVKYPRLQIPEPQKKNSRFGASLPALLCAAAVALAMLPAAASAANYTWNGSSGATWDPANPNTNWLGDGSANWGAVSGTTNGARFTTAKTGIVSIDSAGVYSGTTVFDAGTSYTLSGGAFTTALLTTNAGSTLVFDNNVTSLVTQSAFAGGYKGNITLNSGKTWTLQAGSHWIAGTVAVGGTLIYNGGNGVYVDQGGTLNVDGAGAYYTHSSSTVGLQLNQSGAGASTVNLKNGATMKLHSVQFSNSGGTFNVGTASSGATLATNLVTKLAVATSATFNFIRGTIQPSSSTCTLGSYSTGANIDILLAGNPATISSTDMGGTGQALRIFSAIKDNGSPAGLTYTGIGTTSLMGFSTYSGTTKATGGGTLSSDFTAAANASGNQANHLGATSTVLLDAGGIFQVKGNPNKAAFSAVAWSSATSVGGKYYTMTLGVANGVVGQPITGTGLSNAYIAGIDPSGATKILVYSDTAPGAAGTDLGASAFNPTSSQTVNGLIIGTGSNRVVVNANSGSGTVLNLGSITRSAGGGSVDFTQPAGTISSSNGVTTSTANGTGGILGGWATVANAGWATNNGTNIVTLASYTDIALNATIADSSASNVRFISGSGTASLGVGTTTINTLLQNTNTAATVGSMAGKTLAVNAIMIGTGKAAMTLGSSVNDGTVTVGSTGGELILNNYSTNTLTINSVIADNTSASSLTKLGNGLVVLAGTNTFSGVTTVQSGSMRLENALALQSSTVDTSGAGSVVFGNLSASTFGGLQGANNLALTNTNSAAVNLTVGNNNGNSTFSGALTGGGSLTKTGTGTLTLSGTSTYSGATSIKAGALLVSGSISASSNITVGDSSNLGTLAVLAGGGNVGNVVVGADAGNTGAQVKPSNGVLGSLAAVGTRLTTGSFQMLSTGSATLALQIGRTSAGASSSGDNSDRILASGVDLGATANLQLTLQSGYTPAGGDVLYLIINGGLQTGKFATVGGVAVTNNGTYDEFSLGGNTWYISYTADASSNSFSGVGTDVAIQMAAIPEPTTWAMLLAGLGMLRVVQRSRRKF